VAQRTVVGPEGRPRYLDYHADELALRTFDRLAQHLQGAVAEEAFGGVASAPNSTLCASAESGSAGAQLEGLSERRRPFLQERPL